MKAHPFPPHLVRALACGVALVEVALLEQLFDHAPDVVFFIKDAGGRYVVVNQSLVERCGLAGKAQLIGRRPEEAFPGELGRIFAAQDAAVLQRGRALLDHLELQWHAPRRPCWCLTTKLPLRSEGGRITGLIGLSRDVRAPIDRADIPPGLAEALAHLETHLAERQTPALLARRAGLSPVRLGRLVKRIHGLTPGQVITRARIGAASRLLRETARSIATIAVDCGFYDHAAFTRAFRAATGQTPTQFREAGEATR